MAGLLRSLGGVVFRRAADSTLRFLEVDGPCPERMGLSSATLTGDAYSFWTRVDPLDRRRVLSVLEEAIRKGSAYRVVYRLQGSHGRTHRVREQGAAIGGPDGRVVSLDGVILDAEDELSEAQRARAAALLEESQERFQRLAEHSREMIAEISPDRLLSFASPRLCEELGRSESDLRSCDPLLLVHPEDRENVLAACREAVRTGERAEVLCRLARSDESWLWVELGGCSFRDASGEPRGVVTGRDVGNRIRVEEAFLAQRLAEARIGKLSRRFIELGNEGLDDAILEGVEAAAAIGGADRCYLIIVPENLDDEPRTWVWQRQGLEPWSPKLGMKGADHYQWMRDDLKNGEVVRIPRVADLPPCFAGAREHLQALGIRSYCVIPVRSEGRVTALLAFQTLDAEHDWSEQDLALLRLVAELFAGALQRRETLGELRDGEQRFRALVDTAQDAILETELVSGEILYANPRYYEIHGYDPETSKHMTAVDFVHPEEAEKMHRVLEAFARGDLGESISGTMLYRGHHRDGRVIWLEGNGRFFRTAAGEARSTAMIRDVTEREAAQRVMERRLENQRRIGNMARDLLALGLEEIDAGVEDSLAALLPISGADRSWLVATDPTTGVQEEWEWCDDGIPAPHTSIESMALEDFPYAEALLRSGREMLLGGESELPPEAPEMVILGRRGATAALVIPLLSGSQVVGAAGFEMVGREHAWTDEAIALLRLGGEILVSAISRKRAEEALRESRVQLLQAQKMDAVGTLAGGVAHDFNNQLSVILGNARFVAGEVADNEELHEAMVDLERAGEYCAQLTRSLLSFSRHVPSEPRATSVSKVLRDVAELTGPLLSSGVHFQVSAHDELERVYADRTQLQQVLVNLVVNARDAMPDGGNVTIRSEARKVDAAEAERLGLPSPGEYVRFVVADTGFGMDPATLGRIFEPFFTTKEQGKGTGLGLATVYGILQESGGTIWAESVPGVGTTFKLLLPRVDEAAEQKRRGQTGGVEGGETLLLVEDDPSVRRLMRRMLGRLGFHVLEAADGAEALRISDEHPGEIEVLVSDVSLPEIGGVELGRRLLEARPTLRVLLLTGHAEDDVSLAGARLLCKPFRQEELEWALEGLLG